jgi:hypothetical protein
MMFGTIKLYCAICGEEILYQGNTIDPKVTIYHHRFGTLCGKDCFDKAETKYARMILGKDDLT